MSVNGLPRAGWIGLSACVALLFALSGCSRAPEEADRQAPPAAPEASAAPQTSTTPLAAPGDTTESQPVKETAPPTAPAEPPIATPAGATVESPEPRRLAAEPATAITDSRPPAPAESQPEGLSPSNPLRDGGMRNEGQDLGRLPQAETPKPAQLPLSSPPSMPAGEADKQLPAAIPPPGAASANENTPPPAAMATSTQTSTSPAVKQPAAKPFGKGKHSGIKFDPVKENGVIFPVDKDGKITDGWPPANKPGAGWPKPTVALVISGHQDGYLEPCGCAGLDRMKGGLSRRETFYQQLRQQGWPVVGLDVGGLIKDKDFGRQAELKFETVVEAMRKMGYGAIAFSKSDLQLPAAELVAFAASVDSQQSPFVAANVGLFGFESGIPSRWLILEAGGKKIGVTAVLGNTYRKDVKNSEVTTSDPVEALKKIMPELKGKADLLVLLANASMDESKQLAEQFPEFNVVVTAGGPPEPPREPARIGKTYLIEVGEKGMNVVVLGFFDNAPNPADAVRYQRVALDSRFKASEDVRQLMAIYQLRLAQEGLQGLGIRAVPYPRRELLGDFVGSEKCATCHEQSYAIWKKSGHARAWQTLVQLNPPRNSDPECIACHVVGWNTSGYFPYESGFLSEAKTPNLVNVGCESCHGPGGAHVAAETGSDVALQEKLQKAMVITKEESEKRQCGTCHDLDNSPDFEFKDYWPQVEHYEDE